MKNQNTFRPFNGPIFLFLLSLLIFIAGCSFPRGVSKFNKNKLQKAEKLLNRADDHKTYGPGARYYLVKISVKQNDAIENWINANKTLCDLEKEVGSLSFRKIKKLGRHEASRADISKYRGKLQDHIYERMSEGATVKQLLELEKSASCWEPARLDSLRTIIVNKTIAARQQVYDIESDKKWKSPSLPIPSEELIRSGKGYSCASLFGADYFNISYDDATIIAQQYPGFVLPINYDAYWKIKRNIWMIFQVYNSYCDMDKFKTDHPYSWIISDCWFDEGEDVLCLSDLKSLLAFHRNTPHTALDYSVCFQVLCLMGNKDALKGLNAEELLQALDIQLMLAIHDELLSCGPSDNDEKLIENVAYLIKKYEHHEVVYDLAKETLDYFATARNYTSALNALEVFKPLFTDASVCAVDFDFQVAKLKWFDTFTELLNRAVIEKVKPGLSPWNTSNDEYALISWGETNEVFFVRRSTVDGSVKIMTSTLKDTVWSAPKVVEKLSISADVIPFSISANGREILLKAGGKLMHAYRLKVGRQWSVPEELLVSGKFAVTAWLSPNDSLLLTEYYVLPPGALSIALSNIAVSKLQENDTYGNMRPIGNQVNLPLSSEGNPFVAVGGRQLFYTSDKHNGGLGEKDMYAISLNKPNDWSTMDEAKNIGIPVNTIFDDSGLTYFSEYTGKAYFYRTNKCSGDKDIWEVSLSDGLFPGNAMRLAGLVLDENRKPIGDGFVEFTPNYQLNVHAEIVSTNNGVYTYTVADSTRDVRIFPEMPGYYSERDTIHSLENKPAGGIIRDTFILTSFDYIRKHFKLEHSTFYNGTSNFNNPDKAYPELTRLAKIAVRMGANLVLKGHTDNTGPASGHERLSQNRAESVKQFLVKKCGFDANRIQVFYFGSSKPNCSNDTEEGRRCNRRVEVTFVMPKLLNRK